MNGKFIVFEGPDGSGKTTVIRNVKEKLTELGYQVHDFREPGGTAISEKIRSIILDNENSEMDARCECLLYAASRAQLINERIRPLLEGGDLVICDRFVLSSLLYQGLGRGLGVKEVENINYFATGGLRADLTLFLNIDYKTALERKKENFKADRLENEDLSFHKKVFDGYLALAEDFQDEIVTVDATCPLEEVVEESLKIILELLKEE